MIFLPDRLIGNASPSISPAEIKVPCFSSFRHQCLDFLSMTRFSFSQWSRFVIQALSLYAFVQQGLIVIGRIEHSDLIAVDISKWAASGDGRYCLSMPIQMSDLLSLPIVMLPLVMF